MNSHDNDNHDRDPDNPITPATPSSRAMVSLEALGSALNAVDTSAIRRSGLPMLVFKAREGNGTWSHGQRRTVVEEGARWAVNPTTFQRGYVCFSGADKKPPIGERLASVSLPMPDLSGLPDLGFPWTPEWAVCLKCIDGADAGLEVIFKATTDGGVQAVVGLLDEVRSRLNSKTHGGLVSPIVVPNKYDYNSTQFGKIWAPLLDVVAWMSMDGPAPAPTPPASPPPPQSSPSAAAAEQPRRRRVG